MNSLDEPVFMSVSKLLLTEFGIHHRLESCDWFFYVNGGSMAMNLIPLGPNINVNNILPGRTLFGTW